MREEIRKSLLFIGLTFLCSYALAILFFALGGKWNALGPTVMAIGYMFILMIAALAVQKFVSREPAFGDFVDVQSLVHIVCQLRIFGQAYLSSLF